MVGAVVALPPSAKAAADGPPVHIVLWADRDDDDDDGRPDGEERVLPVATHVDLVALDRRFMGAVMQVTSGGEHARIVLGQDGPMPWNRAVPEPGWLQGLTPGRVELVAKMPEKRVRVTIDVRGLDMRDGAGMVVDMARSHASLERTPPARIEGAVDAAFDDPDALRVVLALPDDGPGLDGDREIAVESLSALGARVDAVPRLALSPSPCARAYPSMRCWASGPLRLVIDDVDRNHPLVAERSIKAEVGGAVVLRDGGHKVQTIRVLGPRTSPVGPIGRLRATIRPFVLRVSPGGAPAIGGSDVGRRRPRSAPSSGPRRPSGASAG